MTVSHFTGTLPEATGLAMVEFEKEFSYPLGNSVRFRISHGADYLTFFRAMGDAHLLVAGTGEGIRGAITRVQRTIRHSGGGGSSQELPTHYLCDLKVRAAARGSDVLACLFRQTREAILSSGTTACYCVVMEGTGRLPTDYTGRIGIPGFEKAGEIMILRIVASPALGPAPDPVDAAAFAAASATIPRTGYTTTAGQADLRSSIVPRPLVTADGNACGILEDTRRGKRLLLENGDEFLSAHLSSFAYRTIRSAAALLHQAAATASSLGLPAVFVSIPITRYSGLLPALEGLEHTTAPASIYAHHLLTNQDWWIDTAEI